MRVYVIVYLNMYTRACARMPAYVCPFVCVNLYFSTRVYKQMYIFQNVRLAVRKKNSCY